MTRPICNSTKSPGFQFGPVRLVFLKVQFHLVSITFWIAIQVVNYLFIRMECCEDAVKINYEVRKRSKSKVQNYEIVEAVKEYLTFNPTSHAVPSFFKEAVGLNQAAVEFLRQNVSEINICEGNGFIKVQLPVVKLGQSLLLSIFKPSKRI